MLYSLSPAAMARSGVTQGSSLNFLVPMNNAPMPIHGRSAGQVHRRREAPTMAQDMPTTDGEQAPGSLEERIARCERCAGGPVVLDWLPISFYGDYASANAWVVTINPSDREYVDRNGLALMGERQRFSSLGDFPSVSRRGQLTADQVDVIVRRQREVFYGIPYRSFFEKLGRFLVAVHGGDPEDGGLHVFTSGLTSAEGREFTYSHVDTVKCATRLPWAQLDQEDKDALVSNCLGFIEEQLGMKDGLELMMINGRTAYNHCLPFLADRFGYQPSTRQVAVGRLGYQLWWGNLPMDGRKVDVVGWSPNIVNSRIRKPEALVLANAIREVCPGLR